MYSYIADIYHEIFPLNNSFINFITSYLGPAGSRILDLGCGPGDYIHFFSDKYEGFGIDANEEMIRMAKSKKTGTFTQMAFDDIYKLQGPFSCVFSIGNSLSYLPKDVTTAFFANVYHLLKDLSGYFVLQVVNWDRYKLTGKMDFPVKTLVDGRTFHRSYEPTTSDSIFFRTRIEDKGQVIGTWADVLHPKTTPNLISDIESSGMTVVDIFGDFEYSAFIAESSPAIVLVAQRAK